MEKLDYRRLGRLGALVADALGADRFRRVTKRNVVAIVAAAVRSGLVATADLKEAMRAEVEQRLRDTPAEGAE